MKKLLLIDGHAMIFKMYYAFLRRPMINSKGEDTSILFGFIKTLLELIQKERPTHLAIAFDPPARTFRHELYEDYKANRSETPEQIKKCLEPLSEIITAMSVPVLMKPGFEADDVIGTLAKAGEKRGYKVYMVTPDKDYGQLISDNIFQYKPGKNGSPDEIIGKKEICDHYGIKDPLQVIDILTIWGDASDNVPGVRGIGEVGSKKLIGKYGSLEQIYNSLLELPEKQQSAFKDAESHITLSKRLITIDTEVDIPFDEEHIKLETPHFNDLKKLFARYEFNSLTKLLEQSEELFNIQKGIAPEPEISGKDPLSLFTESDAESILKEAEKNMYLCVRIADDELYISSRGKVAVILPAALKPFGELLSSPLFTVCGYDLKRFTRLTSATGIKRGACLYDIELMHYIIMPESSHKADILIRSYLGIEISAPAQQAQASLFDSIQDSDSLARKRSLMAETSLFRELSEKLNAELKANGQTTLYTEMEMPLIPVLADIETEGFKIDTERLAQYNGQLKEELDKIEQETRELAGDPTLNISSPKQLGVILYEKLKIADKVKTTSKKNYSTDEETLNEYYDKHPIIPLILEYRNVKKLISTYIEPLPTLIDQKTGKIHTTFNQALTATGRLSSIRPNLQNIPIRTERGREIRKAFIPSHNDGLLLSADYSQIELRIMAHLSGDSDFIEAFRQEKDIHTAPAAKIFKIREEEVTKDQRNRAKTANFGIIYGISAFGLSQRLSISRTDAKRLIEDYFLSYPKVKEFMTSSVERAKESGFVTTIFGRKRYLPDINSKNPVVRGLAERNAINAPIQGSAADIIKAAMIKIHERMEREGLSSKMILQVHDELVFDTDQQEAKTLATLVKEEMESVVQLSVPLTVECDTGTNWLEAH